MKILALRFKNLNSLTGEWQIDFTRPPYTSDGIFAITGPTGAGKTTILDAICLGLYGRTPRLDRVTKSSNEIMSRQTGECFAEVTFETQLGRYRSHWSQHRARKRHEGELQQARHEIAAADDGTILESRIAEVGEFIEQATGMDFERFTRSMLLAQGGFATFLQADPDKRSPILEQITGTDVYSRISMHVHQRRTSEREMVALLEAELKGIRILSDEEERNLQNSLKEKLARETELTVTVDELRTTRARIDGIAALEKELVELEATWQNAQERADAFAPDAERLDKSRRALSLQGDYRGATVLRSLQRGETQELTGTIAALPAKEKAGTEAFAAHESAKTLLGDSRTRQASEGDIIKKVRELDARLNEQQKQIEEKDTSIADAKRQIGLYQERILQNERFVAKSQAALQAIIDYQSQHRADAGLLANLAAIGKQFASLRDHEAKQKKLQEERSAALRNHEAAAAVSKKSKADYEACRLAWETKEREVRLLNDELGAMLKGREITAWHQDLNVLKDRERGLGKAGETIDRIETAGKALDGIVAALEELRTNRTRLVVEIGSLAEKNTLLEREVARRETEVALLTRIRDLEEERARLEDGKPCPLCGSVEHPYAEGNVPALNEAERELTHVKTECKKAREMLSKREAELAKAGAEIGHRENEREETIASRRRDEILCADALTALSLPAGAPDQAALFQEALAAVQGMISESMEIVAVAAKKSEQEKQMQRSLEQARTSSEKAGHAWEEARHRGETAGRELERLGKESDALAETTKQLRTAILHDVLPFGIEQLPGSELDTIQASLAARRDAWQKKLEEQASREKAIAELTAEKDKGKALLAALEKGMALLLGTRDELMRQYNSLRAARRELFGERNPDQVEHDLAHAVDEAGRTLEGARDAHAQREKEIGILNERIASLRGSTEKRSEELARVEQNLAERFNQAGFSDETAYFTACLNEDERELLTKREQELRRELTELDARRKDRSIALASCREKQPAVQSRERILEQIAITDRELEKIRLDRGAIIGSLQDNETLKGEQREGTKKRDARKREYERWENLHQLIGSADGKKYRNFVQGLTFEIVIRHANRQLQKMTDRYLLVRDPLQPLELSVIDSYQAGETRSTKNLSGGESFIVSLALALGLSQMAGRNVRVDSLFLDEGFGSLDEDALETALETLASLRREGKLIGVISHVPALKERIAVQIQVVPETGGRSSITGPGCSRR